MPSFVIRGFINRPTSHIDKISNAGYKKYENTVSCNDFYCQKTKLKRKVMGKVKINEMDSKKTG